MRPATGKANYLGFKAHGLSRKDFVSSCLHGQLRDLERHRVSPRNAEPKGNTLSKREPAKNPRHWTSHLNRFVLNQTTDRMEILSASTQRMLK